MPRRILAIAGSGALIVAAVVAMVVGSGQPPPSSTTSSSETPGSGSPSASAQPSSSKPTPSIEPAAAIAWTAKLFPERMAPLHSIAAAGDQLLLSGEVDSAPVVWYSDDEGSTWHVADFRIGPERPASHIGPVGMAVLGDVVLGIAVDEHTDPFVTLLWSSRDRGATWNPSSSPGDQFQMLGVEASGFVGVNYERSRRGERSRTFWQSRDGLTWEPMPAPLPDSLPVGPFAARGGREVYVLAYTDNGDPDELHPPSVWTKVDGQFGRRVALSGGVGRVYSVESGPEGFFAAGYRGPLWEEHRPAIWFSADGIIWEELRVERSSATAAIGTISNGLGTLGAGWWDIPQWGISPVPGYYWFSSGGTERFRSLEMGHHIIGMTALPNAFVGFTDCSRASDCLPVVLVGRAAASPSSPSPSPVPIPVPTLPPLDGGTPRPCAPDSLTGTLRFSEDRGAFVIDAEGGTLVVVWPADFYAARIEFGMGLFMDGKALVALDGDVVSLGGEMRGDDRFLSCRDVEVIEPIP
jgi:hypothetical protein